jgi:hypothetical protein
VRRVDLLARLRDTSTLGPSERAWAASSRALDGQTSGEEKCANGSARESEARGLVSPPTRRRTAAGAVGGRARRWGATHGRPGG